MPRNPNPLRTRISTYERVDPCSRSWLGRISDVEIAVCEQVQLLFLDAILHLAPRTVGLLVQLLRDLLCRADVGHLEARTQAHAVARQGFGLGARECHGHRLRWKIDDLRSLGRSGRHRGGGTGTAPVRLDRRDLMQDAPAGRPR